MGDATVEALASLRAAGIKTFTLRSFGWTDERYRAIRQPRSHARDRDPGDFPSSFRSAASNPADAGASVAASPLPSGCFGDEKALPSICPICNSCLRALDRSPDAVQHDDMKSILKLLVLAALCASANSWAKVDAKFERWLGRTTAQVLEAGDRVEVFVVGPQPVGSRGSTDDKPTISFRRERRRRSSATRSARWRLARDARSPSNSRGWSSTNALTSLACIHSVAPR